MSSPSDCLTKLSVLAANPEGGISLPASARIAKDIPLASGAQPHCLSMAEMLDPISHIVPIEQF